MKHFCQQCDREMKKEKGTKGIYKCKCGFSMNTKKLLYTLKEKINYNVKCSDGLPCTPETCIQTWCKFPERKIIK